MSTPKPASRVPLVDDQGLITLAWDTWMRDLVESQIPDVQQSVTDTNASVEDLAILQAFNG